MLAVRDMRLTNRGGVFLVVPLLSQLRQVRPAGAMMDQLDKLESQSVYILREAYREFKQLVMLWSIGKDSTVLLHRASQPVGDC